MDPKYSAPSQQSTPEPELPSMMKSLTAQTPDQPGAMGEPQYPSLAAAVAVDQPPPQTFANLMASGSPPVAAAGAIALSPGMAQLPQDSPEALATVLSSSAGPAAEPTDPAKAAAVVVAPEGLAAPAGQAAAAEPLPGAERSPHATAPGSAAVVSTVAPPSAPPSDSPGSDLLRHEEMATAAPSDQTDQAPAPDQVRSDDLGESTAPPQTAASTKPESLSGLSIELDLLDEEEGGAAIAPTPRRKPDQQVRLRREEDHVAILLPQGQGQVSPDPAVDFIDSELWQELQPRLSGGEGFGPGKTPVHLYVQNCLLDTRQLQEMAEALDRFDLKLDRIVTSRRQTAVAAAMSGYSADQTSQLPDLLGDGGESSPRQGLAEPLYLQKTVRSGAEIRHPGSVIIVGDLNPGSSVIADGDILIWGRLRGVAHAGASGNSRSIIMALKLEPTQLRIAESVALAPASPGGPLTPEVAYVTPEGIRIAASASFTRPL